MAFTPKEPSAQDRDISLVIPKAKDPYLVEFYQQAKKENESVNNFVIRNLMLLAHGHSLKAETRALDIKANDDLLNDKVLLAQGLEFLTGE